MDYTVFTTLAILINPSGPAIDRALSTWRHLETIDGHEMSLRHVLT